MNQSKQCNYHKQAFTYYCESCDEPVCEKCISLGPHNYNLHRINQLQETFKQRVDFIQQEVLQSLQPKRQEMTDQIQSIEYRIQEIKHMGMIIERDCRAEMNGILDRLNQSEGIKQAKLQHQIQIIQQDLEEINEIEREYTEMSKDQDYFQFLAESKKFIERIELIILKPFDKNVNVVADDLPKELADLRIQLERLDKQKELLNKLNEIIWKIMNEKKQEEDSLQEVLKTESKKEIKEWAKLVDFFASQLKESQMVCYFCNSELSPQTINKKCKKNTKHEIVIGFTIEKPNDSQTGNERHFFGHSLEQKSYTLQQEQKKLPTGIMIEAIVSKIKLKVQENKLNLDKLFSDHDEDSNGFVNDIVFNFIMQEHLLLVDEEIEALIEFMDMKQEINYNVFMQMLRTNKAIQDKQQELLNKYKPIKTKKKN